MTTVTCDYSKSELRLDATVIPWLNEDLKTISGSKIQLRPAQNGVIKQVCDFSSQLEADAPTGEWCLPVASIWASADLTYSNYTLGKDVMSMVYCPYCPLTRAKWSQSPECHLAHEDWTIEKMTAMFYDDTKQGTAKLGVKSLPKIECIDVPYYTFPSMYVGLGVDHDSLERFESYVEDKIVKIPGGDR